MCNFKTVNFWFRFLLRLMQHLIYDVDHHIQLYLFIHKYNLIMQPKVQTIQSPMVRINPWSGNFLYKTKQILDLTARSRIDSQAIQSYFNRIFRQRS